MRFADVAKRIPRSGIREVMDLSARITNCIHLEVGQPNFPSPPHVIDCAERSVAGNTHYIPNAGLPQLRESVARYFTRRTGVPTSMENILITQGGVLSCATALFALLDAGDEVLLSDPGWPNYHMAASMAHAKPVFYDLPASNAFLPDMKNLEALLTPRTKLLFINSPSNPTGQVLPHRILADIMAFARLNDIYVLSDEIYSEIVFDGRTAPSALQHDTDDRVILVSGMSKNYSMTGFRVGFTLANKDYIQACALAIATKLQEPLVSCGVGFAQLAAVAALDGPQDCVDTFRTAYKRRRDIAVEVLKKHGMLQYVPQGAFYILVDISSTKMHARDFALKLLEERQVAVAPGSTFGESSKGHVRVAIAASDEHVREGMEHLCTFIREHS